MLVVDDLITVAESIRDELLSDYDVDVALSAFRALKMFMSAETAYDGLIVDVNLEQGAGGLELVSDIRSVDPHVRILVISAYTPDDEVRRRATELGAAYARKTVTPEQIRRIFEQEMHENTPDDSGC